MTFCMLKRGNRGRLEARELVVPAYTSLATQIRTHRDAQKEEHDRLKQRVLQYETMVEGGEGGDEGWMFEEGVDLEKVYNRPLTEGEKARLTALAARRRAERLKRGRGGGGGGGGRGAGGVGAGAGGGRGTGGGAGGGRGAVEKPPLQVFDRGFFNRSS